MFSKTVKPIIQFIIFLFKIHNETNWGRAWFFLYNLGIKKQINSDCSENSFRIKGIIWDKKNIQYNLRVSTKIPTDQVIYRQDVGLSFESLQEKSATLSGSDKYI